MPNNHQQYTNLYILKEVREKLHQAKAKMEAEFLKKHKLKVKVPQSAVIERALDCYLKEK